MPSPNLSQELESCLNAAFRRAREARQELLTVEHLLLAILDTPKVQEILGACRCDVPQLRQDLKDYLDQSTPPMVAGAESVSQPTHGFQRVLQRAVFRVKTGGQKEVDATSVLVAVFSEKQSHAVFLLHRQKVTRLDVCNYVSHSLTRPILTIGSIVIHTPEFVRTVAFWQAALGYVSRERATTDWIVLCDPSGSGPNLAFQARDHHPRSRSWVHLDLYASNQEAEVTRLLKLGARRYPWRYTPTTDFIVLEDPGGNLFCVVAKPDL